MNNLEPKETYYNGYRFRSRLEARWAVFFDTLGIKYEYEPEGIRLSYGKSYLPDFYLPHFHCYFEVKRAPEKIMRSELPYKEFGDAIRKISDGMYTDTWAGIIAFGDPYDHYMWVFCQAITDSGGGSYDNPVVFGYDPGEKEYVLFSWSDFRDREFGTSFSNWEQIPIRTRSYAIRDNPYLTKKITYACKAARQSRFEYGEDPNMKLNYIKEYVALKEG